LYVFLDPATGWKEIGMARSGKTGLDRIHVEGQDSSLADAMAAEMIKQTWPGVFAGGKEIIRTHASPNEIIFWFDDGSAMRIAGEYEIEYKAAGPGGAAHVPPEDIIEGTIVIKEIEQPTKQLEEGHEVSD
jgi:hypothetical protein